MGTHKIAVYTGDGIATEVVPQAMQVLDLIERAHPDINFQRTPIPWGLEYWRKTNQIVPDDYVDQLRGYDAIYLGALGAPAEIPDHIALAPIIRIRQAFDQYACVRPAKVFPGVKIPLAEPRSQNIDLIVLRENSEGEYVDNGGRFKVGFPDEVATQTAIHTRRGVERILRFGFDLARTRRKRLTMITKSNAQRFGYVMWDEILEELRGEFADVEISKLHIDAAAMDFVRRPEEMDVVVASNLFGDILSDLGGIITGGLGTSPSANINPERRFPSMFEPVHGSAPDIAGRGIANPVAAILAVAMMLDWLESTTVGDIVREAVSGVLRSGKATADLGGTLSTSEFGTAVAEALEASLTSRIG